MKKNIINRGMVLLVVIAGMMILFRAEAQQAPVVRCNQSEAGCDHQNQFCAIICLGATVESPQYRVTYDCREVEMDDFCSVPGRIVPEGGDDGIPVAQMCAPPIIRVQGRPIGSTEGVAFESCDIVCEDRAGRVPVYRGHGDLCGTAHLEAYNNLGYPVWIIGLDDTQNRLLLNDCANNINGRLQQQQRAQEDQEQEQEMQACREEAARIRSTLTPLPAPYGCDGNRASSDPVESVQRCAPDIRERWYPCRANCDNDCASVSVACTVYAPTSDNNRNARGFDGDIGQCNQMCHDELARLTAGMPNCGAAEIQDTGITPEDLAEGGEGEEPWEPDGGWGPEDEGDGEEEEIDNEDLPAPAGEDPEEGGERGYSRNDYEREAHERAMEYERAGMSQQAAENRAIAETRSEMNERSVESRRDEAAAASETGINQSANVRGHAAHVNAQLSDISREETLQQHASEIPRSHPDANRTPSVIDTQSQHLIGEGQNGRTTGDPVINGHFCIDKVFAKAVVPAGQPVEVTGKYCSYQAPSVTASGALGPGWTLNVESHILYYPGSSSLSYQDPHGDTINFVTDEALINTEALQNSCAENFGSSDRFFAVGKPLVIEAQISTAPDNCHQVVFEFQLLNDNGDKSYFKRTYDLTQPYMGTTEVETRYFLIDSPPWTRRVNNLSQLHARDLPVLDIPQYLAQTKDLVRRRSRNAAVLERENDPGPLGMNLLSQSYPEANAFPPEVTVRHDAALNSSYVYSYMDAGFFSGSEGRGRFVSYALPAIVAPVVRWEDASGNRTDIERTTSWEKYYTARVSGQRFIHNWREIGPLQEREENFRGQTVTIYSYDEQMMREDDHFVSYTLYETLIPRATEVVLRNGDASTRLEFVWQLEHDITASGAYNSENLFRAPISSAREDIMVLKTRPILTNIFGNTDATFGYGYAMATGTCELFNDVTQTPTSIAYNGHMAFMGRRDPGDLPARRQHQINGCRREDAVLLRDVSGNDYYAGPLVLTHWFPPHPTTGNSTTPFDPASVKPDYFVYKTANPQASELRNTKYPLHYILMTETGSLDGAMEAQSPYIINAYNDDNLVETHQLGDTGAIQYTYENCEAPCNNLYSIHVTSRGGVSERFRFYGQTGRGGNMETHTYDVGGENEKTIFYEYESAPEGKPYAKGRIKAIQFPGERRVEYTYRNAGDPYEFYNYHPRATTTRVGRNGADLQRVVFDYVMPQGGGAGKISRMTMPAPNSEAGNERVATDLIYDFQPAAQNEGLNPCNADQPQGNLVKKIYPDGTYEAWKHNRKGQPIFYRNPFGIETTYSYFGTGEGCGS